MLYSVTDVRDFSFLDTEDFLENWQVVKEFDEYPPPSISDEGVMFKS